MKAVLFGATKGIGRAVARALVERGDQVFLLGRDAGASRGRPRLHEAPADGEFRRHDHVLRERTQAFAVARRRNVVRVQLGRRRARPQAGRPLRRDQGRAQRLSRRARSQVSSAGRAHRLRQARLREAEAVARDTLRAIDRGAPVLYTPRIWALIMMVIRALPRFVMRRIGF